MKRYALFGGAEYYPGGGWDDFLGSFDTVGEAREAVKKERIADWWHVVDLQVGGVVEPESERQ